MKMHPLKRTAADRRAEEDSLGSSGMGVPANAEDHEGPMLHLDHHHLKNMKAGELRHGDRVTFHGEGHVEHADESSGENGERRTARIRMTHGGMEHESSADEEHSSLKSELMKMHEKSESAKGRPRGGKDAD